MGVSTPRRCRAPPAHKKKSLFLKRSSSSAASNDVPTPRTLERRTIQKESLANLFSELNLSPGPFSLQSVKSEQKDWKLRATALQSPQVRRLCRNLQKRKQLVRSFTRNAGYGDIFKRTERSKEDEAHRFMLETALSYSPVELVARNLIDKVANNYQRERHGVWAQLGRPYSCLGVPAISIPKEHPNPREIEHINAAEEISPFFQSTSKPIVVCNLSMARRVPVLMKKSGLFLDGSRSHLNLQCLLLKMGLSHLHDVAHTKFPKKPLEISNHLRKTVRVNTPFSQVMSEKSSPFQSSGPFSQQSIQLTDFRAASFQRLATITPQVDGNAQSVPSTESVEHTNDNAYMGLELPHTGQEVFEWTRQFLTLRKGLQERLNDKLLARAIRREQCRSCPPFTAEVSSKLLVHMEESCSRQTPILTQHLWKLAEENQGRKRPTSAPLLPEVESISNFYERVCLFVNNQRDDDPLMEVLVHRLKELLESGFKLQKELLSSLCYYMGHLPENVICTGRMSSVMPILYFICKELRVPSTDYYMLLRNSRLDRFHGNSKNLASTTSN